jgi:hypothetical protein
LTFSSFKEEASLFWEILLTASIARFVKGLSC